MPTRRPSLLRTYERISPETLHRPVWHLIPTAPSNLLDIGAGGVATPRISPRWAVRSLAVEPVAAMREGAMKLHPSPRIEWLADALPVLALVRARGETFHAVLATAVSMHLDAAERAEAMLAVASLVRPVACCLCRFATGRSRRAGACSTSRPRRRSRLPRARGSTCLVNTVTRSFRQGRM